MDGEAFAIPLNASSVERATPPSCNQNIDECIAIVLITPVQKLYIYT